MTAGGCEVVGPLLAYPDAGYLDRLEQGCEALLLRCPEAARRLAAFAAQIRDKTLTELQELYTQTFDLNPVCALEVGWQLYGEDYRRGRFLAVMREQLQRHGVAESRELPDHLTHVMALLDRMEPDEAAGFAQAFVAPAVKKMVAVLAGKQNPFADLLQALEALLPAGRHADVVEAAYD